jgi:predicted RNase H-like nuclease (RuvC/YqgF family)
MADKKQPKKATKAQVKEHERVKAAATATGSVPSFEQPDLPTQEVRLLRWRLKQVNKTVGTQGETIHRLRSELAEVRELNSKLERGELRRLERVTQEQAETIDTLEQKLAAADDEATD